jgi:leader peptidase (prepilin peptidase)/N-methyltransferase
MGELFIYLLLFLVGASIGSFLNVLIYRFSKRENLRQIISGRSYCPHCKTPLRWYDNIPLLSFVLLEGKCRYCSAPISLRYFFVEFLGGLSLLVLYHFFHPLGWPTVLGLYIFVCLLLVLSFIDWETFEVPDIFTFGGTAVGLILSFLRKDITPLEAFIGALIGFLSVVVISFLYKKFRGVEALGLGDAKFLAMVGAFLGPIGVYCSIFLGSVFALLYFLPQVIKSRSLQFAVPFVPFLALGALVGLICKFYPYLGFLSK